MNKVVLLLSIVFVFSCSEQEKAKTSAILSENQMIDALVQVHLLEAASQLNMLEGIREDSLILGNYYSGLFIDKSYSLENFKSSFSIYAENPKVMEVLLDSALTRIQMME
jgi:hypothetical protein